MLYYMGKAVQEISMIDYKKSIVLVGGVGAGKSLVGRAISRKTGLEIITADEFRHLPTMKEINSVLQEDNLSPRKRDEYIRFKYLREKYPDIKNYSQFGFKFEVSQFLEKNFGKVAWHYYQKQFENLLVQDICDKVSGAIVLDTGGGMPISLDREYDNLRAKFESIDSTLFHREFTHLDMVSKDVTHNIYFKFENVVYLKFAEDIMYRSRRAQGDFIGSKFVESKDYEAVSTITVDTTGLYVSGNPNFAVLDNIVDNIIQNTGISADTMEGENDWFIQRNK